MNHEHSFLSKSDQELLERDLNTTDPTAFPGLSDELPKGVALRNILFRYDATPEGGKKAGHKEHIPCAFGHGNMHWRGFGIELENGQRGLIGKDCGMKHFELNWQKLKVTFEALETRQKALLQLITLREKFPAAISELKALNASPLVSAFDEYWKTMRHSFGKMSQALAKSVRSSQGRLMTIEMVRNDAAMEKAARRKAENLEEQYNTPNPFRIAVEAKTAEERKRAVSNSNKLLAQQSPIMKSKDLDMGACDAWELLRPSVGASPTILIQKSLESAETLGQKLLERSSSQWTRVEYSFLKRGISDILNNIDSAWYLTRMLLQFTEEGNIKRISIWTQQYQEFETNFGQDIQAEGRTLVDMESGSRLELLEEVSIPKTPHLDAIRVVSDRDVREKAELGAIKDKQSRQLQVTQLTGEMPRPALAAEPTKEVEAVLGEVPETRGGDGVTKGAV